MSDSAECLQQAVATVEASNPYSDPIYKQLSLRNGEINKMTKETLKKRLEEHRLDTRGVKEVLKKRLKNYYKRRKLIASHKKSPAEELQLYDFILVIDFEATCQEHNPKDFKFEIIEFPIVLIDVQKMVIVGEFHAYCKPVVNSRLTEFCTKLTGITQQTVDKAKPFREVLDDVEQWMTENGLGTSHSFAVLTDGPWDMGRFMSTQCKISGLSHPSWAESWINLRKLYSNYYDCKRCGLQAMLQNLEYEFEGQPHSGIDDARNIARVAIRLLKDGAVLKKNEKLQAHQRSHNSQHGDSDEGQAQLDNPPVDGALAQAMKELKIREPVGPAEHEEGIDDLLHYYKLSGQKKLKPRKC